MRFSGFLAVNLTQLADSPWWRVTNAPTPEEWTALFAALTLIAAIVAAVIALGQLHAHLETARAQSRPYVIVDFTFKSLLMQVEIKNIGTTAAGNLSLRVDPPFESGDQLQADRLNTVFSEAETISMLAPGRRIIYSFDRAPDYYEAKRPEKYTVTATYGNAPAGFYRPWRKPWKRLEVTYQDVTPLDFRQWSRSTAETDYDNKNWNIAMRQEKRTEKLVKAVTAISRNLDSRNSEVQPVHLGIWVADVVEETRIKSDSAIEIPVENPVEDGPEQ